MEKHAQGNRLRCPLHYASVREGWPKNEEIS
jgi:hypothetical protein